MSKIFGTLAAVLLAVSGFIHWKNIEAKKVEDADYQTSQNVKASTTKDLNKQTKRLNDADTEREEKVTLAAEVELKLEGVTADYGKAKKVVEELKAEHAIKEADIAKADDVLKELPDPTVLVPKVKRMRSDLAEATGNIASEEAKLASLTQLDKNGKAQLKSTRDLIALQSSGKSFPTMKTHISSIYRNWGFVVLGAGDRQGVVTDSILDVVRGGEVIAKLKVTAVEAGRASADIILDSLTVGTTLRPGDSVVAEREAKKPAAATTKTTVAQ